MATGETDAREAVTVRVTGTVQGVGFRPFVARTAAAHDLAGVVRNTDRGVQIRFEGAPGAVGDAVETVRSDPPPLASVEAVETATATVTGATDFEIVDSTGDEERTTLVPPDTAICPDCLADLRDPGSQFHDYWATGCVNCGPRFTVTAGLPYDRDRTALAAFPPCEGCRERYETRTDRRFHAQTVACPDCGPRVSFEPGDDGATATGTAAVDAVADRLRRGAVVGVEGAGGSHLVCTATEPTVVDRLRERTGRARKPFAVMAPTVDAVESFAAVSAEERETLTDRRRPVVVVDRLERSWLESVAPGLDTVGVMLPYSGLHHLLFDRVSAPLVVTSANRPGEPTCTETERLRGLSAPDALLTHDREIVNRADDSVVRVVDGRRQFLRRSRGWVPDPIPRPGDAGDTTALGVGARSDTTAAAAADDRLLASQHVGRVTDPATEGAHRAAAATVRELLDAEPDVVGHDLHPEFRTRDLAAAYAAEAGAETVGVWHHHAHAASLLADHGRERAVVIAADGVGHGPDGVARGGEVLDATLAESDRVGGLSEFRLPGGDRAAERPGRLLASLLADPDRIDRLLVGRDAAPDRETAATVRRQADAGVASPETTSAGRFLDAVAALLDVCTERRFRGEPAIRLETAASDGSPVPVAPPVDWSGEPTFVADEALARLDELRDQYPTADVAATGQALLADGLAEVAVETARERGREAVGLTGGVAHNAAVSRRVRRAVEDAGVTFLGHEAVPPGDGGLAVGQAVAAARRV
ncbi:carbamoyltransferase HypF [Halobaculum sp. MBLA0143]|uniref:carbamoyltransferase HypF n=1 Tax=Halobaculum sp. MBLA0143 TaxID=3079933 RepID=UPI003525FFEB